MNIGVVGSRNFSNYKFLKEQLDRFVSDSDTIVSGGAQGADSFAELYSRKVLGKEPVVYEAEWDKHGKKAGPMRNSTIVEESDMIIAFWKNESRGTLDTLRKAWEASTPVILFKFYSKDEGWRSQDNIEVDTYSSL